MTPYTDCPPRPAASTFAPRGLMAGALLLAALLGTGSAFAQNKVFRCEVGGRVVFQQSACSPQPTASSPAGSAAAPAKAASAANPSRQPAGANAPTQTGATRPASTAVAASAAAPRR
jgi:hypothetical protein